MKNNNRNTMYDVRSTKKRILIFSIAYYPYYVGGAELAVKEITDRVSSSQIEFHVITLRRSSVLSKEEKIGNTIIHRVGYPLFKEDIISNHRISLIINKLLYPILAFLEARKLYKIDNIDATWSIMANYSGFSVYFFKIFYPKVRMILSLQEGDSEEHLKYRWGGLIALSWKLTLKKVDFLVTISSYLLNRAKGIGFSGVAHLIPNGVDIDYFNRVVSEDEINEIKKGFGLVDGDISLVTTSRLNIKNGIGDVIKALPSLPDNVKFIIFGTGELEKELKKLSIKLGVENRVFFKGFVPNSEVYKYLKASDIFIRPSLSEGMGNSFLEAMAVRLPVIATPVGGIVDFLISHETGYFCKPSDPQSIVDVVTFVMSDSKKDEIVNNAYNMVVKKYDWNQIAKEINEKVFLKL